MGNQSSKPPGAPSSPNSVERHERDKKVGRRVSVQGIGAGKATAADPSASHTSATARNISQPTSQRPIHEQLQATASPELIPRPFNGGRLSRQPSRDPGSVEETSPSEHKTLEHRPKPDSPHEPSIPVAVPTLAPEKSSNIESTTGHPGSSAPNYLADYAKLQRPPRLPLPIAEVDHAPGSPLLAPVQTGNDDVAMFEDEQELPRKSSMLSSTTMDEEELGDELSPFAPDSTADGKFVPTIVEWREPGEKVYVTGTFANWDKKYKLHKKKNGRGSMSVVLQLPPGTHHVKFIVDGEMKASNHLPTAVDYTNVLVNYIEVNADDISAQAHAQAHAAAQRQEAKKPMPGTQTPQQQQQQQQQQEERAGSPESDGMERSPSPQEVPEEEILESDYRQLMPQALADIDKAEDTEEYGIAYNLISETGGPPSLPLFLGRSILNGMLPMKDDASVLTLPNHTVLNHLATCSIKNNVLATSVTTRFKKKYVTTIMYKPTGLDEKQRQ